MNSAPAGISEQRPNLFEFATSELSQDAFISWLLSWADQQHASEDALLHGTAVRVLNRMLELSGIESVQEITSVRVKRQAGFVDVLAGINDSLAVLIEDKVHTTEHSNQLERYLKDLCSQFSEDNIAAIYLKTGNQCDYSNVESANYASFSRSELLQLLRRGRVEGITNNIYSDFLDHIEALEAAVNSYLHIPTSDWGHDRHKWTGFFMALRQQLGDGEWGYVPNPSGGFMGFWWHWSHERYLQLEEDRLCFKIRAADGSERAVRRDQWSNALTLQAEGEGIPIEPPKRKGIGKHMTAAIYKGDYRSVTKGGLLDLEGTVKTLRDVERLAEGAAARGD